MEMRFLFVSKFMLIIPGRRKKDNIPKKHGSIFNTKILSIFLHLNECFLFFAFSFLELKKQQKNDADFFIAKKATVDRIGSGVVGFRIIFDSIRFE